MKDRGVGRIVGRWREGIFEDLTPMFAVPVINAHGWAAGSTYDGKNPHPAFYTDHLIALPNPPGVEAPAGVAQSISDDGLVLGGTVITDPDLQLAFAVMWRCR
jgi:hypothetical protein